MNVPQNPAPAPMNWADYIDALRDPSFNEAQQQRARFDKENENKKIKPVPTQPPEADRRDC